MWSLGTLRKLILVVVGLVVIPSVGAATLIVVPAIPEQVIEGHTVWAVIETLRRSSAEDNYAAAVAVLVRERVTTDSSTRFPGVIWFNDQFLTDPSISRRVSSSDRYPCTGAVIAVNRGDFVVDIDLMGNYTLISPTYIESYHITDPNEHTWIVDVWNTSYGPRAWTVAIQNNQAGYDVPDNGACRGSAYSDRVMCTPADLPAGQRCQDMTAPVISGDRDIRHKNPGDHGIGYPCQGCQPIRYNALLYFRLEHLTDASNPKNHTEGTGDDTVFDPAACHDSLSNSWRCPNGDDDREGNSHPYNPDLLHPNYAGRNNHGGSADCEGVVRECHATRNIDIYFGYLTPPLIRNFWLVDTEGIDAPYHCHDSNPICPKDDADAAAASTPVRFPPE